MSTHTITATNGGKLDLSKVETILPLAGSQDFFQILLSDGTSEIDLSSLNTLSGSGGRHRIDLSNQAQLNLAVLESATDVTFNLTQGAELNLGTNAAEAGSYNNVLFNLTQGAKLTSNGTQPVTYSSEGFRGNTTIMSADGEGTVLDLSSVISLDTSNNDGSIGVSTHTITATNGGKLDLSKVETITPPDRSEDRIDVVVNGDMSEIDLSSLQTINGNGQARFNAIGGFLLLGNFTNTETITASGGGLITINDDFLQTSGSVNVSDDSEVTVAGDYTQTGGSTNLLGGTLDITGNADIQNGSLVGTGTLNANTVINDSIINPGNSTGSLNLNGNYTQTSTGTLDIEIGGTNIGEFDQLVVRDTADLDGILNVTVLDSYTPTIGDRFEIITFGDRTGEFINTPTLGNGLGWDLQFESDRLSLVVV